MSDGQGTVSIGDAPARARFDLRIDPTKLAPAATAFGAGLPARIGEMTIEGPRRALCVGPDEWLLWADEAERESIESAFAVLYDEVPHSLVDIGDREVAITIEGLDAELVLAAGCPLDLAGFRPGSGTRTIFDTVPVTLTREASDRFELEVWRSFAPHVRGLLELACEELAFEPTSRSTGRSDRRPSGRTGGDNQAAPSSP